MIQDAILYKSVAVGFWFAFIFIAERIWRAVPAKGGCRRIGRNTGLWLINMVLSPLIILPVTFYASNYVLWNRPEWWNIVVDIVVLDFLIFWWHMANHKLPLLWRFHEVHHLDEHLDSSSAVRFHFGEVLLSAFARAAFIIILAVPFVNVVIFEGVVLAAAIFHHSNLKLPADLERALTKIIITPSIHWVHHHAIRADTDSNYGTIFSFWDRLFKTKSLNKREYDMKIGVEGRAEKTIGKLIIKPFSQEQLPPPSTQNLAQ